MPRSATPSDTRSIPTQREKHMPRIAIAHVDQSPIKPFPLLTGISSEGRLTTKAVMTSDRDALHVWVHELKPGAVIRLTRPPVDHSLYVWSGAIEANDQLLPEEGAVIVEHKGKAVV